MADDGAGAMDGGAAMAPVDLAPVIMADVMERLHILDYESEFCLAKDIPPFSRIHFAVPLPNAAVQFSQFVSLCAWLLGKLGRPLALDRYEDPASTISKLCTELKNVGFEVDFPPMKLRQAYGENVCKVLLFLSDAVLRSTGFSWSQPLFRDDGGNGPVEEEPDYDDGDGIQEEDSAGGAFRDADDGDAEEDEAIVSEAKIVASAAAAGVSVRRSGAADGKEGDSPPRRRAGGSGSAGGRPASGMAEGRARRDSGRDAGVDRDDTELDRAAVAVMQVDVDPVAWRAEVERVAPRLKQPGTGGALALGGRGGAGGEWRTHLDSTKAAEGTIEGTLPAALKALDRLGSDLSELMEMLSGRERYINSAFKGLAGQYATTAGSQKQAEQAARSAQTRVSSLSAQLAAISESLEDVRSRMEEKGATMTDTSPLIRIKAALAALRTESAALDVQTGVVGHAVMQSRLSHKFGPNANVAGAAGGGRGEGGSDEDEDSEGHLDGSTEHRHGDSGGHSSRGGSRGGSRNSRPWTGEDEDKHEVRTAFIGGFGRGR